ncbi:LemA family protein [Sphingomonas nostoxanthinifaciens]|uniref:LemA family protein n=1 Tax=Sphingomonas nostoxanthinifaciens TaxID=2872652 RepID=UPI001CC1F276|nr:LemA family protein [Sphingomonas nostoxanthinifaciens]UAK23488.1 LemA family protein [Sphingomonas nostoxanthinifaciens]
MSRLPRLAPALLAPVAALALGGCGLNAIPTAEESAKARWADVQNEYQRRADLVPNLVATVKGAAQQEKSVLIGVTEARAKATSIHVTAEDLKDPAKIKQFGAAQGELSQALGRLLSVSENYPDLKSNENFLTLQSQLEGTENRITIARRDYNGAVQQYNTLIRTFPNSIGAKVFYGAKPMQTFEATAPNAQAAPTVSF